VEGATVVVSRSQRARIVVVWLRALADAIRGNLILIPVLSVLAAIILAQITITIDNHASAAELPPFFRGTVASTRALLGTIAGATITVTGLVFSLIVVALQLAASQFSPRALRLFFRSRFQQLAMGFMVGTFTYCLVVLHSIRSTPGTQGEQVVPSFSSAGALLLGILSVIAIVVYVDRTARGMRVGEIIRRIAEETLATIHHQYTAPRKAAPERPSPRDPPAGAWHIVRARHAGWILQAPPDALLGALPAGTTMRLEVRVGMFVTRDLPLCAISPPPAHPHLTERLIRLAIEISGQRSMQEDIEFGFWLLNDVALRALSPAVNVPNTARDVIAHLGLVLQAIFRHAPPPRIIAGSDGRSLERPHELTRADYVGLAFDQIRRLSATYPEVAIAILRTLALLRDEAQRASAEECLAPLGEQVRLLLAGCRAADLLPDDLQRIRETARDAGFASD
jgi:uncharacterized membrane protein